MKTGDNEIDEFAVPYFLKMLMAKNGGEQSVIWSSFLKNAKLIGEKWNFFKKLQDLKIAEELVTGLYTVNSYHKVLGVLYVFQPPVNVSFKLSWVENDYWLD